MRTNEQKDDSVALLPEDCPVIAGYIDTSAVGESLVNRVIVEKRIKWLVRK